ncbi:ABC transporter permease subunit [Paenibacillus sediminis]|uniref:Spermidine/putrescine transport system permease protein n=1 Tax=Paenibacillus sediminis TaxID=664909 RepID=A0ABS4H2Y9_9BACL|nr:ABC transporter permease subunit [Paenibacillus sediminis]MBP1936836.1 putative spermidine/putrescine transport system permease protein [Paenibacillus sediminis]
MKRINGMLFVSIIPFFILIALFLFIPLFSMIYASFQGDGGTGFTFNQYAEIFQNFYYHQAFKNSIMISLLSSLIAMVMAIFAAYSITLFSKNIQDRILIFANLTSNFAGIPLAFAFIVLLGNSGLFTLLFRAWGWETLSSFNLYSWSGLILIYVYFQLPLAVMLLYPVYQGVQAGWKEAASLLGASSLQFWVRIGAPVMLPSVAGTFSILFANAMGAYASAYALTGSTYNLVTIRVGALTTGDIFARPELGSALAVLLGLTLIIAMFINEWLTRKVRRDLL